MNAILAADEHPNALTSATERFARHVQYISAMTSIAALPGFSITAT